MLGWKQGGLLIHEMGQKDNPKKREWLVPQVPWNKISLKSLDHSKKLGKSKSISWLGSSKDSSDFQAAFANAVQKRVQYAIHPMFIGLSSGYDSGAIHVALVQERTTDLFVWGCEDRFLGEFAKAWIERFSCQDTVSV